MSGKCCGVSATAPTTTRSSPPSCTAATADARPVLARARAELAVHGPLGPRRHPHLDEQLVGRDARLVVAEDQLLDRDRALAARRAQDRAGAERREHRRRVRGVVGVGEHAADGRLVAHPRAGDDPERAREHRPAVADARVALDRRGG